MKHFKESKTSYKNKRMWRADIGNFQYEAIDKLDGKGIRVDIYEFPEGRENGSFIDTKKFDTIEYADFFIGCYSYQDFSLGLSRIRDDKCPVCGGDDIKYDDEDSGDQVENWKCYSCHAYWTKYYDLTGYGNVGHDIPMTDDEGKTLPPEMIPETVQIKNGEIMDIEKWPEIVQAILTQKKVLPALVGIDTGLDKLIAERLKGA